MLATEQQSLGAEIVEMAEKYGRNRSALLPILQAVQEKHHHISDFAMQEVAKMLDVHPVEVYSVVTFYAFLNTKDIGRFVIRLCRTISCDMQNKDRVARQLQNELGIEFGETTQDGNFTLEWANCLGMCDQGPAMLVNDQVFTQVTAEKVHDILEGCRRSFGLYPVIANGGSL
ncbi:MAG: NADH-quinone oxidoreductase subunit NuoE [Armatimonadota bacterium]|nr:NADH-quinone oxidoreductase subunit NuoE [Armatimonadota bacterium]